MWWWLEEQYQQPYLLTVVSAHCIFIGYQEHRVKALAQALPEQWQRLSCGDGTKGERIYDWARITIEDIVCVAGARWRIEECFAIAKDRLGLSQYEVRSWQGWQRHMTLVLTAQAFLSVLRHQVEPILVPKKVCRTTEGITTVWLHSKRREDCCPVEYC
ncbi:hypothetical protein IFO70_26825 [Phormidium tenue FACHB-886]|nr:hypothetical protein [Phormidium tenue FACHB-886]